MTNKVTAQEIVADVMRIQRELGRIPSRTEYPRHGGKFPGTLITEIFGSYALMLRASGLAYSAQGRRNKQEIRREAFSSLQAEIAARRAIWTPPQLFHRVLVIGDPHAPYMHPDAVTWLLALHEKYSFDLILCAGDEVDFHAMSFHDHDVDLPSAGYELEAAIRQLEPLYKAFPKMRIAESNHGSMVYRKGKHHGFPRAVLRSYREVLQAPEGWTWEEKIRFQTSDGSMNLLVHSLGANVLQVAKSRGMNVIQGHHHELFGVQYFHNEEKNRPMYGAQTGCLADDLSLALAYNRTNKFRPIMGSGGIFEGVYRPLEMFLDQRGRWNQKLP